MFKCYRVYMFKWLSMGILDKFKKKISADKKDEVVDVVEKNFRRI